jgi:hypothetical protein
VSYEVVGVGDSDWVFLDGSLLGAVVIYTGQDLGFIGWYGVLKFESKITKKGIK